MGRCHNLVAHQGKEWRDQEGRAVTCLAQELGGDEVDETLAPSGLLDDEEPSVPIGEVADGVPLAIAEGGVWVACAGSKEVGGAGLKGVFHVMSDQRLRRIGS